MNVVGTARIEAALVSFVDIDALRRTVGRKHDLLAGVGEAVEQLEHDIDRGRLALEILHVVDEQRVRVEIAALECLEARFIFAVVDCGDGVFRDELLRVDIHHAHIRPRFQDVVLDSSQQVRLAQTAFSVDEQGVQGRLAGRFRYRYGH